MHWFLGNAGQLGHGIAINRSQTSLLDEVGGGVPMKVLVVKYSRLYITIYLDGSACWYIVCAHTVVECLRGDKERTDLSS